MAHLEQLDAFLWSDARYRAAKPALVVEDNGLIHVSKLSRAALAACAHWLTVEWLAKYTPELNDIEVVWHDLKAFNLAHQTFTGVAELDGAIHKAVGDSNRERAVVPLASHAGLCLLISRRTIPDIMPRNERPGDGNLRPDLVRPAL